MKECQNIDELIELASNLYNGNKSSLAAYQAIGLIIDLAKIIKNKENEE